MRWRFYVTDAGGDVVKKELAALGTTARAAVVEAMNRRRRGEQFPYEDEAIDKDLRSVRVFFDSCTYRLLYSTVGAHDQVLLALHVINKKDRKLPRQAQRLAAKRLSDWKRRGR
jgi:phage-related protein